jgi:hypothetical protein
LVSVTALGREVRDGVNRLETLPQLPRFQPKSLAIRAPDDGCRASLLDVDRCEECHYVFDVDAERLPGRLTAVAAALGQRLTSTAPIALVRRPTPESWSALELVCHVRDVFFVQRERVVRVLVEDRPSFPPMHRDERAIFERYAEQLPAAVAVEVSVAARLLGGVLTGRSSAELERLCVYNYPEPTERSLLWIVRNALHEGEHHLLDVDRALASG